MGTCASQNEYDQSKAPARAPAAAPAAASVKEQVKEEVKEQVKEQVPTKRADSTRDLPGAAEAEKQLERLEQEVEEDLEAPVDMGSVDLEYDPDQELTQITVVVYAENPTASTQWTQVEGFDGPTSDCGEVEVCRFQAFKEPAKGLSRFMVVKAEKGKGNWLTAERRFLPDKKTAGTWKEIAHFYARSLALFRSHKGAIYSRWRNAETGGFAGMFTSDPDPSTSVGGGLYLDKAWDQVAALYPADHPKGSPGHINSQLFWELPPADRKPQRARYEARENCRVQLFQSANVGDKYRSLMPSIDMYVPGGEDADAKKFKHAEALTLWQQQEDSTERPRGYNARDTWDELTYSVMEATEFVYVVGWSVNTEISLLREKSITVNGREYDRNLTVGDMLVQKANEGCKVCVMIWSEMTGVAGTLSKETDEYFKNTKVVCQPMLRKADLVTNLAFTHHQKCIVVDAPALRGSKDMDKRRCLAFMGGLDITTGRYDDPGKSIINTLKQPEGPHKGDFYQACISDAVEGEGPRQPWQDIHSKLEGQIARDVIDNFERRWKTQADDDCKDAVYDFSTSEKFLSEDDDDVFEDESGHPERWAVQFFRSIDNYSDTTHNWGAWGAPKEKDIEHAYVNAIMKSQRFVYIENQYFMGASLAKDQYTADEFAPFGDFDWDGWKYESLLGCGRTPQNRVPLALAARIVKAIDEDMPFHVYINFPMFPEGIPTDAAMQEIVHWQFCTIRAMYKRILAAIKKAGTGATVADYISFGTLANREPDADVGTVEGDSDSRRVMCLNSKRHMIYIHSKFCVVDDEYAILGSSNINDRSMDGDRDTEIAFGAWQPSYCHHHGFPADGPLPPGHIHAFRRALWTEHLGLWGEDGSEHADFANITDPGRPECFRYIKERGDRSWEQHAADEPTAQDCHLMTHPTAKAALFFEENGNDAGKEQWGKVMFPDAPTAKIIGEPSGTVPDWITC